MIAIGTLKDFDDARNEILEVAMQYLGGEDVQLLHSEMQLNDFSIWVLALTQSRGIVLHLGDESIALGPFPLTDIREVMRTNPEGKTCVLLEDDLIVPKGQIEMGKTSEEIFDELCLAVNNLVGRES